jgi:hypothetical protein
MEDEERRRSVLLMSRKSEEKSWRYSVRYEQRREEEGGEVRSEGFFTDFVEILIVEVVALLCAAAARIVDRSVL